MSDQSISPLHLQGHAGELRLELQMHFADMCPYHIVDAAQDLFEAVLTLGQT